MRMKHAHIGLIAVLAVLIGGSHGSADSTAVARNQIRAALEKWTRDFNAGNASQVCSLFAPDLISNFQGIPESNFETLCARLKRSVADPTKRYHYDLDLKEIIVSGDLAAVRLVSTLKVHLKDGTEETSEEPGLDIFRRQSDGSWKISRYMAYTAPPTRQSP